MDTDTLCDECARLRAENAELRYKVERLEEQAEVWEHKALALAFKIAQCYNKEKIGKRYAS